MDGSGHMWDNKYDSFRGKDTMTFSLNYQHQETDAERGANKKLSLNCTLSFCDKKSIRLLVYENDDVQELALRLVSFLNCHGLMKVHHEHHELFHRSLIYFIETKM